MRSCNRTVSRGQPTAAVFSSLTPSVCFPGVMTMMMMMMMGSSSGPTRRRYPIRAMRGAYPIEAWLIRNGIGNSGMCRQVRVAT